MIIKFIRNLRNKNSANYCNYLERIQTFMHYCNLLLKLLKFFSDLKILVFKKKIYYCMVFIFKISEIILLHILMCIYLA